MAGSWVACDCTACRLVWSELNITSIWQRCSGDVRVASTVVYICTQLLQTIRRKANSKQTLQQTANEAVTSPQATGALVSQRRKKNRSKQAHVTSRQDASVLADFTLPTRSAGTAAADATLTCKEPLHLLHGSLPMQVLAACLKHLGMQSLQPVEESSVQLHGSGAWPSELAIVRRQAATQQPQQEQVAAQQGKQDGRSQQQLHLDNKESEHRHQTETQQGKAVHAQEPWASEQQSTQQQSIGQQDMVQTDEHTQQQLPSITPAEITITLYVPEQQFHAVARGILQLLVMCYPSHMALHQPGQLLHHQDRHMRACAPHIIPMQSSSSFADDDDDDYHAGARELLVHVIGDAHAPGQAVVQEDKGALLGASGLRYLYRLQWQPYDATRPAGRGQLIAVLTDGHGVWLVVAIRDIWLAHMAWRRRKPKSTAKLQRKEASRRERRAMTMQGALRAARELEGELEGWQGGAVVFSAMCVSLAEGLEIVAPRGGAVKRREEHLAKTLIPQLRLGQPPAVGMLQTMGTCARLPWDMVGMGRQAGSQGRHASDWGSWLLVGGTVLALSALLAWSLRTRQPIWKLSLLHHAS